MDFEQLFFLAPHKIDQEKLQILMECLESLPHGLPLDCCQDEAGTVVTFLLHYHVEGADDYLAMCGSVPQVGQWQVQNAVRAQRIEKAGPDWWFCQLKLPCSSVFTWRWVVLTGDNQVVRWEERAERNTGVFYKPAIFHCAWNAEEKSKLNEDLKALKR